MDKEYIQQLVTGTDNFSVARGLSYVLLATCSHVNNEVSECLLKGETGTEGLIALMRECLDFIENNAAVLRRQLDNFSTLCEAVRKEN